MVLQAIKLKLLVGRFSCYNGGLHVGCGNGNMVTTGNLEVDNRAAIGGSIDPSYQLKVYGV